MKTIILGTGFLGSALFRHLDEQGEDVVGFSSTQLDLLQPESLYQIEPDVCLVVTSSLTPTRAGNSRLLWYDNVSMIRHLAQQLEQRPVQHVVYLSSDALYAFEPFPRYTREDSPLDLSSWYALGKYTCERLLQDVVPPQQLTILRLTGVYGPGSPHDSYGPLRFIRQAKLGGPDGDHSIRLFGAGDELRDHLYVDDAVTLISLLRDVPGLFNVATGFSQPFRTVAECVRSIARERGVQVDLAVQPRTGPQTQRRYSIERLRQALTGRWHFQFQFLENGLNRTWESLPDA